MQLREAAPSVGALASLGVLAALVAPYLLLSETTGLGVYYSSGPIGASALGFLALMAIVGFLAGRRGRTDAVTAAGLTLVLGLGMLAVALSWALAVSTDVLFSFPAAWMESHRWVVVGVSALVPASAAVYARSVV